MWCAESTLASYAAWCLVLSASSPPTGMTFFSLIDFASESTPPLNRKAPPFATIYSKLNYPENKSWKKYLLSVDRETEAKSSPTVARYIQVYSKALIELFVVFPPPFYTSSLIFSALLIRHLTLHWRICIIYISQCTAILHPTFSNRRTHDARHLGKHKSKNWLVISSFSFESFVPFVHNFARQRAFALIQDEK